MRRNNDPKVLDDSIPERRVPRARLRPQDLLDYFAALAGIEDRRARRDVIRALRTRALQTMERGGKA